jgi:hypothetical protein
MEVVAGRKEPKQPQLFNSPVETALRTLLLLDALHPRTCNVAELTWFDHVVVNTGDFPDAPPSLHPASQISTGELLVRRHLVADSLRLLMLMHLAEEFHDASGIQYAASEEAPAFLDMLATSYNRELRARAAWVAEQFSAMPTEEVEREISKTVGRWTSQLQEANLPIGTLL